MNLFNDIGKAIGGAVDQVASIGGQVASEIGEHVWNSVRNDPLQALGNPLSIASSFVDGKLQDLGIPAEFRGLARFAMDPAGEVIGCHQGSKLFDVIGLVSRGGQIAESGLKQLGETVADTGEFLVAVGRKAGEAGAQKAGQGGALIAVLGKQSGELLEDLMGNLKEGLNRIPLPDGASLVAQIVDGTLESAAVVLKDKAILFGLLGAAVGGAAAGPAGAAAGGVAGAGFGHLLNTDVLEAIFSRGGGLVQGPGFSGPIGGGREVGIPGSPGGVTETGGTGGTNGLGGYQPLLDDVNSLSGEINDLRAKLENATPEERMTIALELQAKQQERLQLISTISNLLKQENDSLQAVINNLR